jgi:hypothetical protein
VAARAPPSKSGLDKVSDVESARWQKAATRKKDSKSRSTGKAARARACRPTAKQGGRGGGLRILAKPYRQEDLLARVRTALEKT